MSVYDSDTNTRMTRHVGNRELAKLKNLAFLIFMFGIIGFTSYLMETFDILEDEDEPVVVDHKKDTI